jgi:Ca-activated chloride channel family protein
MIRVIVFFMVYFSLGILANAGLTDFKTIDAAHKAYEAKEYGKSALLLEGIKKSNDTSELHYNLGNTYYKKGYYEKAIEEYKTSKGVDEE